jgi:zinc transport system ATP-binding protein
VIHSPAIVVDNVNFSYDSIPVLEGVSFVIDSGDFTIMVGPNGGGKTTLLKLILGLLKPRSGSIRVFGKPPENARHAIGYMPQYQLFDPRFPVTVEDVVLMGLLKEGRFGLYSKGDRTVAALVLEEIGMAEYGKRSFSVLSGGQRQRALLARALVGNPEILLLDEPTANVDLEVETRLMSILEELNRRMTILMVTHDLGFVTESVKACVCVNRKTFVHPTSQLTGEVLQECYGQNLRIVRHDKTREM